MTNVLAPKGFRSVGHVAGGTPGRTRRYGIASGLTENIYDGDLVKSVGDGTVSLAGETDAYCGVFRGVNYRDATGSHIFSKKWATGTATLGAADADALIEDDPNTVWLVQTTGTLTRNSIGQLVNMDNANAGDDQHQLSGQAVDGGGGAEIGFRVIDIVEDLPVRNTDGKQALSAPGLNAWVHVIMANHEYVLAHQAPAGVEQ